MELTVGAVLEGKVKSITNFGAFISLPENKTGLVHISEVANSYVSDINEHLKVGQTVSVRVLNISEDGKINLSIKKAAPPPERSSERPAAPRRAPQEPRPAHAPTGTVAPPSENQAFEDRLKKFMQESDSRMSGNKLYADRKGGARRRK